MYHRKYLLFIFVFFQLSQVLGSKNLGHLDVKKYLEQFGYYSPSNQHSRQQTYHSRYETISAIRLFQKMNGVPVTGKMNRKTLRLMSKPRCGNPDIGQPSLQTHSRHRRQTYQKYKRTPAGDEWLVKNLTWKISRYSNKLSEYMQRKSLDKIFKIWSEATPLKISYTSNDVADIDISFARWSHGDGPLNAFDGRGRLLAHAYGPGDDPIAGDIHLDNDEDWTMDYTSTKKHAKDFFATALHEAGHSLGLPHSSKKNAVMYPFYKGFEPDLLPDTDDIYQLQTKYGVDPNFVHKSRKLISQLKPTTNKAEHINQIRPTSKKCQVQVKAMFYGGNERTYLLSSYQIYRINQYRLDIAFPVRTRRLLRKAPINPQAAVYLKEYRRLYLFKGNKVWKYTNMKLNKGYPLKLSKHHPQSPVAAVNIPDSRGRSRIFVFGKTYFWSWNYIIDRPYGRSLRISAFWKGVPKNIDAAFQWNDGYIYIVKGSKYYKVSSINRQVLPGYPKYFTPSWFGGQCGSQPK